MPPQPPERNRKACDKCHQQKLSCKKIGGGDECERCHRLKRPCTSSPPLRNQRSSTTRRNPREHDGGRRRAKTLAILPRSPPPPGPATTTAAAGIRHPPPSSSYSSSESGSSCYSQDQDTTASAIPVLSEQLVTDTAEQQHQHQQQYIEPVCWPGNDVTAAEFSSGGAFPPYFVPFWPEQTEGGYQDKSPTAPQDIRPIQAVRGFADLDPDLEGRDVVELPLEAHLVPLQHTVAAAPPIASLDTREPTTVRHDLGSYACFSTHFGFGPGFGQYGGGGYGPGSRVRFDWLPVTCSEASFQEDMT
ncbi:hypothetical protein PG993_008409 [Apiospora rasikravindrae]|uniref:Zn(2)-C6 fungal-type domain-containing protein n=1 Tax=Apiospora rasikravindrae TaxID=990691 RepID=A0ABR1T093_9PEZI